MVESSSWTKAGDVVELDWVEKFRSGLIDKDEFKVAKFIYLASRAIGAVDYPSGKEPSPGKCRECGGEAKPVSTVIGGYKMWFVPRRCEGCRRREYGKYLMWKEEQERARKKKKSKENDLPDL